MAKAIASTKSTRIRLSDAQLVMMSAAAQREDRCLGPTATLKGATWRKAGDKLMEAGLVREVRAKPDMPVWRRDDEAGHSLKLTAAGARAIAVDDEGDAVEPSTGVNDAAPVAASEARTSSVDASTISEDLALSRSSAPSDGNGSEDVTIERAGPKARSAAPRPGSKIAEVLELLARDEGASINEIIVAADWLPHTTRAALSGLRKRGYAIERNRENEMTRYRLRGSTTREATADQHERDAPDRHDNGDRRAAKRSEPKNNRARLRFARTPSQSVL